MIDVGAKPSTERVAVAKGSIEMSPSTFEKVLKGEIKKGDVLAVAQLAGIMGAKRCPDLIPLCHPIQIDGVEVRFEMDEGRSEITVYTEVKSTSKTGVEMEALVGCATALLAIYDMCKSLERGMKIEVQLVEKRGGRSGRWKL